MRPGFGGVAVLGFRPRVERIGVAVRTLFEALAVRQETGHSGAPLASDDCPARLMPDHRLFPLENETQPGLKQPPPNVPDGLDNLRRPLGPPAGPTPLACSLAPESNVQPIPVIRHQEFCMHGVRGTYSTQS